MAKESHPGGLYNAIYITDENTVLLVLSYDMSQFYIPYVHGHGFIPVILSVNTILISTA